MFPEKQSKVYSFDPIIYLFNAGKPALKSVDIKWPTVKKHTHICTTLYYLLIY